VICQQKVLVWIGHGSWFVVRSVLALSALRLAWSGSRLGFAEDRILSLKDCRDGKGSQKLGIVDVYK
jgi:hypothetical protein